MLLLLLSNISEAKDSVIDNKQLMLELEEVKLNCKEFRPNLITKFIWREGPTRSLLYQKCLDQTEDDQKFNKYADLLIKGSNISDLSKEVQDVKTRLTFFTLANSLKVYLTNEPTSDVKIEIIRNSVKEFKKHYKLMRSKLNDEINYLKEKETSKKIRAKELLDIVVSSEDELDKNIEQTLKFIDFVLKDHNAYVVMHDKFFPKIYIEPVFFYKEKLTVSECEFLRLNLEEDWWNVKKKLKISCVNKEVVNVKE